MPVNKLKELEEKFLAISKQIKRKNASKRPIKIKIREYLIIRCWNDILRTVSLYEQEANVDRGLIARTTLHCYLALTECLAILKSTATVEHQYAFVTEPTITTHEREQINKILNADKHELTEEDINTVESELDKETSNNTDPKMPDEQSAEDFWRLATKVIDAKYDGEPEGLDNFIDQIKLLAPMVKANNKDNFINFLKTRCIKKAKEAIPEQPKSIEEIINALKDDIKFKPSREVEGKLAALRIDSKGSAKFVEKVEKLAEELRQSLVFEGHTKAKAKEMTVQKTVDLCYGLTRSDNVKSVLSSVQFAAPGEVVSKFIVQQDTVRQDNLTQRNNNNANGNRRFGRKFRGNYRNGNYRQHNNNQNNNNNNNNNRGQNQNNNNSNRGYRNNRPYRGNNNNQRNGNRQEQVLRIVGSENSPGPSNERRAITAPHTSSNVQFELLN